MPATLPTTSTPLPAGGVDLPGPQVRPGADLVIYDGHCRFCQGQVRRLDRWSGGRLAFLSLHDPEVARRFPDLTHDMLMREMYVVEPSGQRHAGAAAARYLSRRLPWLWPLAPLLHLPGSLPLWRALYAWVARRRYRWGRTDCDGGTCSLHFGDGTPEQAPPSESDDA